MRKPFKAGFSYFFSVDLLSSEAREDDEYTVRVAHSVDEDKQLIEAGFEYFTERDGFKI